MSTAAVDVSGLSPSTTKSELGDFFSFCGKITSIDIKDGEKRTAVITFEKHSAAQTALMLNGGTLDGSILTVTSEIEHADHHEPDEHQPHIEQTDKPRAGIAAEYLAKGYHLHDHILQRAIEIDNKHGISKKFLSYMSDLDKNLGQRTLGADQTVSGKVQSTLKDAHSRAKSIDEQKGYSKIAHEYYSKALSSSIGQSVLAFYTKTSKQVQDIHEEALRIKQHQAAQATSASVPSPPPAASSSA